MLFQILILVIIKYLQALVNDDEKFNKGKILHNTDI